jgi:transporter family protein
MNDWKIFALGSAAFAGLTAVLAKVGVRNISAGPATFIRTVVIVLFLGTLVSLRQEWPHPFQLNRQSLIFLILSGITTGLSWLCYYRALQTGPASIVTSIDKFSLVFAILLSILFLHERLNGYEWLGAALITAGTLLVALK